MSTRWSERRLLQLFYGPPCEPVSALNLLGGDYSVAPLAAHFLARLVIECARRSVLEFGAGRSSEVFAAALNMTPQGGRLTSIEHQPEFCVDAWRRVQHSGIDAEMIVAPLEPCVTAGRKYVAYPGARRRMAERGPYDLVFVDAPPGVVGREGALHEAAPHLAPGALVVLDDAIRESEQRVLWQWLCQYPQAELIVFHPTFSRGIGVLRFGAASCV